MNSSFWRWHLWLPLAGFGLLLGLLLILDLDRQVAEALYFDVHTATWLGTGGGDWWARGLLHTGGRWLVRAVAAGAILAWALSYHVERLRPWRSQAGFVALAMVLATAIVGLLKAGTNVDCPWDLAGYGGHNPYVPLLGDRPDYLPRAQCFPGAHASAGFALLCFYFVWRDQAPRLARCGLAMGVLVGCAFSVGQEARGAHFLAHDLASAAIVWFVQLALYRAACPGWLGRRPLERRPNSSGRRRFLLGDSLAP